jgi:hypothetical protein
MARKGALEQELRQERQELAEAVEVLREDLGDVAGKAKKVPLALGGLLAVAVTAKKLLSRRR